MRRPASGIESGPRLVELGIYLRTPDGWKFAERVYEVSYLDTTPLAGSPPERSRD